MKRRTNALSEAARRVSSGLLPTNPRRRESAIDWLAADPVFEEIVTAHA